MTGRLADRLRRVDPSVAAGLAVGIGALAIYRATLLPGVGAWDTAEAQTILPLMGTMHPTGFPAYVVLGWLASVLLQWAGSPAFVINLLSALLAAFATGTAILVMRRLDVRLPVAVAVAGSMALTPIMWGIATAADAHALHVALVVAVTLGLLRWGGLVAERRDRPDDRALRARGDRAIVLTAAVFGIAVANHGLSLLFAPAIGLYVLAVEPRVLLRPKLILAALGACLGMAALLYLELPLRAGPFRAPLVYAHPETWNGFWEVVMAKQFQGDVRGLFADAGGKVEALIALADRQLGPLALLIPAAFLVTAVRHPRYALLSGAAVVVTCVFAASYANANIDRYYLGPAFFAWTWMAILVSAVADRLAPPEDPAPADDGADDVPADDDSVPEARAETDAPAGAVTTTPAPPVLRRTVSASFAVAAALGVVLLVPTAIAFEARWKDADRSQETWVSGWIDDLYGALEPDAVLISWWSYSTPAWYGQLIEGRRPDVFIADDRTRLDLELGDVTDVIERYIDSRPVYVIRVQDSEITLLAQQYAIEPLARPGNVYHVTGRLENQP